MEEAVKTQSPVLGYNASKKFAEKAAWDFLAAKKPVFDFTVINPDIIIGPMIQPVDGPKHVNETNSFACYSFLNGTHKDIEKLRFPFYHFVYPPTISRSANADIWRLMSVTWPLHISSPSPSPRQRISASSLSLDLLRHSLLSISFERTSRNCTTGRQWVIHRRYCQRVCNLRDGILARALKCLEMDGDTRAWRRVWWIPSQVYWN